MSSRAIDEIQQELANTIFGYTNSKKKAAGRALGTIVEIISFYLLRTWRLEKNCLIETHLPEYGRNDIKHNVEFSLHPSESIGQYHFSNNRLPITPIKICKKLKKDINTQNLNLKSSQILTTGHLLRNAFIFAEDNNYTYAAYLDIAQDGTKDYYIDIRRIMQHPYALVECKRVGIEEGIKKGPQTIEKAKQGSYVAKTISSLQKIKTEDGEVKGILFIDGEHQVKPYVDFLQEIIESNDPNLLVNFTLSVGIASNHGNWFSSDNPNKELRILADAYDWLLFLTDEGICEFVEDLILNPSPRYSYIQQIFRDSYTGQSGNNKFTKKTIDFHAHKILTEYFNENISNIENWFNVITPDRKSMNDLKEELLLLSAKNWRRIFS